MTGRRQTRVATALPLFVLIASVAFSAASPSAAEPPSPADPGLDADVWRNLYTRLRTETAVPPIELARPGGPAVTIEFDTIKRDVQSLFVIESVLWREPSGTMRAGRVRLGPGGTVRLSDVTWRLGAGPDRRRLEAERVSYGGASDGHLEWRFHRLRSHESVGLPLAQGPSPGGIPSSGLLPPTFRYRPTSEFELRLAALHGRLGAGPLIEVAPGLWYGVGGVIRSQPTSYAESMLPAGLLEADLRWRSSADSPGWRITGTAHRGTGLRHGSVDLEAVSQSDFWRWEALDATAFGRRWRLSRFGASLAGPDWSLQLDSALYENGRIVPADSSATGPATMGVGLRYASRHALTPWLDAQVRLAHRSRVAEDSAPLDAAHATALFGGLQTEFGRPGQLVAVVGVGVRATQRFASTSSVSSPNDTIGFSTQPAAQLVTNANVQATFEGRFPEHDFVHRIIPSIGAVAAPLGAGPTAIEPARRLTPWIAGRRDEWTAGAATLEQQFQFSEATLLLPTGIWLNDTGWNDGIDAWGAFARVHLQSPHLDLQGAIIHRTSGGIGWDAQTTLKVGDTPRVRLQYAPTNASPRSALLARTDHLVRDPASAARLLQAAHPEFDGASQSPFASDQIRHRAGIRLAWTPIAATIDGLIDGGANEWGGAIGLECPIETLDLTLTLRSVFRNDPESWGLSLGFRPGSWGEPLTSPNLPDIP